jgi:hypothetical protein
MSKKIVSFWSNSPWEKEGLNFAKSGTLKTTVYCQIGMPAMFAFFLGLVPILQNGVLETVVCFFFFFFTSPFNLSFVIKDEGFASYTGDDSFFLPF